MSAHTEAFEALENAALNVAMARAALMAALNFGLGADLAQHNYDAKLNLLRAAARAYAKLDEQ
jgi:hypothetical protein